MGRWAAEGRGEFARLVLFLLSLIIPLIHSPSTTLDLPFPLFNTLVLSPYQNITSSNPLGQPLPPQTYISLLPTVWSLLNQPPPAPVPKAKPLSASAATLGPPAPEPEVSVPHTVAGALLDHLNRVGSDSAVKKIGVEFVGRLCLVSPVLSLSVLHFISRACTCAAMLVDLSEEQVEGRKLTSRALLSFLGIQPARNPPSVHWSFPTRLSFTFGFP